ncbi:MAG: ribonucleotide reductase N-terminal alpha domain-containing protein [Thermoplasmatota archaeon]
MATETKEIRGPKTADKLRGEIAPQISDNARTVLERRYLAKAEDGKTILETPAELFWRVASNIAQAETRYGATEAETDAVAHSFYQLLAKLEFLPNSPTLMNAGRDLQQLSACFVLPVGDSVPEIFEAVKQQAIIHKTGGGTGFSFSRIRPKNDIVKTTSGVASGPISFMKIFNTATEQVKQGGTRRGANMAILRVDHPDIMDFIDMKMDLREMTNFNVSVALTDSFMEAWRKGEKYDLVNPHNGNVVQQLDARTIMDKIAHNAWLSGEPGLFFIDRANEANPVPHVAQIEATNPCVPGDTWIQTDGGPRQVKDLVGTKFAARVDGEDFPSSDQGFFATGERPLVQLRTKQGYSLRLTADHKVQRASKQTRNVLEWEWCEAGKLVPGDIVRLNNHSAQPTWDGAHTAEEGYLMGLLMGDGVLQEHRGVLSVWTSALTPVAIAGSTSADPMQNVGARDLGFPRSDPVMSAAYAAAVTLPHRADFRGWAPIEGRNEWRLTLGALRTLATDLGMGRHKEITPAMEAASSDFQRAFLRGFFDSDGTVGGNQSKGVSVRLVQSDVPRLEASQRMLLRLGIVSSIHENRRPAGSALLPDGRGGQAVYATQPQHELIISGANLRAFADVVGFTHAEKREKLHAALRAYKRELNKERFCVEVESVQPQAVEAVFDAQIPGLHAFDANGFYAHNCGEQDLMPYDSCNLGSIVLDRHLKEVRPGKFDIDWAHLRQSVVTSVRFLDNVIDMNNYPLKQIEDMSKGTRRIGLGIMGFARMLFKLEIPYDSEAGLDMAEQVMRFIQTESVKASEALATERGPYGFWNGSVHQRKGLKPRRNAYVTTIAPTGTISMIAETSGGCEPEFSLIWYKNVMDGTHLPYVLTYFEDVARREGFWYEGLMDEVLKNHGSARGIARVPEKWQKVFATAMDISPEWHVRMQGAFQKEIDAQVSKTINLPKKATEDDVKKAYLLAYDLGCRGITVYRDGSREDQVMNLGVSEKKVGAASATPAATQATLPTPAPASATTATKAESGAKAAEARPTVGATPAGKTILKPRPRPDVVVGTTQKIETGYGTLYVTINEDEHGIIELFATLGKSGGYTSSFTEAVSRMVSLALRSGIPAEDIIRQLGQIRSPKMSYDHREKVLSVPDAIAIALRRFVSGQLEKSIQARLDSIGLTGTGPREKMRQIKTEEMETDFETSGEESMQDLIDRGDNPECPDCGNVLSLQEGCIKCLACGFSEC